MRKFKIKLHIVFILLLIMPFACTKKNIRHTSMNTGLIGGKEKLSHEEKSKLLLGYVSDFNEKSLKTISAKFYLEARSEKKKFKSMGHLAYQKKGRKMNITFFDIIFKSPITYIFQSKDIVKLYFPVDRKLFIDNIKKIKLSHYTNFNMDFGIIQDVIIGKIPLLEEYRIKKIKKAKAEKGMFLVLENRYFYETLSFKGKKPDKILLIEKRTGLRYEIYFKRYYKKGDAQYFKNIRVTAKSGAIKINLTLRNIKLNLPVKVKSIDDFKIRKGLKIIQMTD